jgi:hypothetical protein
MGRWVCGVMMKKKRLFVAISLAVTGIGLVVALLASGPKVKAATIVLNRGTSTEQKIQVTDEDEVNRLASFFPGLGRRKWSRSAAKWLSFDEIQFEMTDGRTVAVQVYDYERTWRWSSGSEYGGDFALRDGFGEYFRQLLEKKK